MSKLYAVYIVTNKKNGVLYIGVTNNLLRRMFEHKQKIFAGFTKENNCTKLVWFEETDDISVALKKEKQLKKWNRAWKIRLILKDNPEWVDFAKDWFD